MTRYRRVAACVLLVSFLTCSSSVIIFADGDYITEQDRSDFILVENKRDAENLGVTVVPLHVHSKSLHTHGLFTFRLKIRAQGKWNVSCSVDYSLVVHSRKYDEILTEPLRIINSQGMNRAYTLQRPNMMKLYIKIGPTCIKNSLEAESQTFALDINKIFEDTVTRGKKLKGDALNLP